ncbi:MAG: type II toxin-antitoxin system HicA family toxin [Candidatus Hinthialibacter antarcticus]|nr:type II toxin-antitoxin system HicA family toxin [Candidatus Hinthialibacter antarcticus]
MNKKQQKTLESIFEKPTSATVRFQDIESMLTAMKFVRKERAGSRVTFIRGGDRISFHRPHPKPETPKYAVEALRDFLLSIGETP